MTGGQAADCQAAERLFERLPAGVVVHADKGYDTDRVRRLIESRGSAPNIPPRSHRRWKNKAVIEAQMINELMYERFCFD